MHAGEYISAGEYITGRAWEGTVVTPTRRVLTTGFALVLLTTAAAATAAPAAAVTPTPQIADDPATLAAKSVATLVASRPSYLMAGAEETFAQSSVTSSAGLQYVSYQRKFRDLPVVGGDFVVVTNGAGQVNFTSVAMSRPIGSLSTTASLTKGAAEAIAKKQLTSVS